MKQQLLLLEDVDALGKKGEVVSARRGYTRNFLLPKGFAVVASPNTLKKQETLRQEREKQAIIDRKEAEEQKELIEKLTLEIKVKVDPEGHMYGSVGASDVIQLLSEQGITLDKKHVQLNKPIKVTGMHKISFKLKEGLPAVCNLHIIPEGVRATGIENVTAPIATETTTEESTQA